MKGLSAAPTLPANAAYPAAPPSVPSPQLSRRSMMAAIAAALAPASVTALAIPVGAAAAPAIPPIKESQDLLALGAEIESKLDTYRAAAARLPEARARAVGLWPTTVPQELVLTTRGQTEFFDRSCYYFQLDLDDNHVYPESTVINGKRMLSRQPTLVLQSEPLRAFAAKRLADKEIDRDMYARLEALIPVAERYEAQCEAARLILEAAAGPCCRAARDLCDTALMVKEHPPRSISGITVHARAVAAYAEAHDSGDCPSKPGAALGQGLADAILRLNAEAIG